MRLRYFSSPQQIFLIVLCLTALGVIYFRFYHDTVVQSPNPLKYVVVEIVGDVRSPGTYIFENSPSLAEAIRKAGGIKGLSIPEDGRLREIIQSGTLLTISTAADDNSREIRITLGRMEARKLLIFNLPLDLNAVSIEDLRLVPGIGESIASRIIRYRTKRGAFRSVEELKNVEGIGEKNWLNLKTFFYVKQSTEEHALQKEELR